MEIKKLFGLVLRDIRNEKGISQEIFALQIGMDRTYYASVEAGKRNISLDIRANSLIIASSSWEQFGSSTGNSKNTVFRAAPILLPNQQTSISQDRKKPQNTEVFGACFGGATRNRTGGEGFADPCLTAWLWRRWSGKRGSNPPPQPWQGCALPNELFPQ